MREARNGTGALLRIVREAGMNDLGELDGDVATMIADRRRRRREHVGHELALARRYATHVAFVADGRVQSGEAAGIWPLVAAWAEGSA